MLHVRIDATQRQRLRMIAASRNETLTAVVSEVIQAFVAKEFDSAMKRMKV